MRSAFVSRALAGGLALLPVPIVAGDLPDPSAIFDNGQNVAVVTANGWAPSMRILTSSPDLAHWQLRGAVFNRPPSWVKVNIWAPEITRLQSGRYAVFYSARSKRRGDPWFCIGVATAPSATGPYRDLGRPIRCGKYGSIDPYPTRDENGKLFLLYKDDGNEFKRPTHIYAQPLAEDGKSVSGTPTELLRDNSAWEGKVVEGPSIVRSNGYFHMLYSGGLFGGTRGCNYALGVARSKSLLGPWEKNPANPIVRGGNGWKCPGHGTIYNAGPSGLTAIYHAYLAGQRGDRRAPDDRRARLRGRGQLAARGRRRHAPADGARRHLAELPRHLQGPAQPQLGVALRTPPGMSTGAKGLHLRGSARGRSRLDAGVIARRTATANYTATAVVDRAGLKGAAQGGLASYRNEFEAIGVSVSRGQLTVWQRRFGKFKQLGKAKAPTSGLVQLRMIARGDDFRFQTSTNGKTWKGVGRRVYHGPIEESARVALTAGGVRGATARFTSAGLSAN